MVLALLVYLLSSDWVYQELRDGFWLGFFPVAAAVAMLTSTVTMICDRHRHVVDEDAARAGWLDGLVIVVVVVACFVYFQLAWTLDFLLVSPVFLTAGIYVLGGRPIPSVIASALVMTAVVYVLFRLIGIELPTIVGF